MLLDPLPTAGASAIGSNRSAELFRGALTFRLTAHVRSVPSGEG